MIPVVAAVIEREGRFLVTRRLAGAHLAGRWEFPGGKVDAGETHIEALRRELREELAVDVAVGDLILQTTYAYPDVQVALHFYRCTLDGQPTPVLGQDLRWVARTDLPALEFPEADAELIKRLSASGGW